MTKYIFTLLWGIFFPVICHAQNVKQWNTPGTGNPFIPGYFADPTIKKFGDTYYLYATTDGNGNGYGPAQVWVSKDFRNWRNILMDWPTTEVVWAPDVMKGADGLYHYFYCEPCVLHEGIGETPLGPWRNILGDTDAVLVEDRFVHNAITLDGQTFVDDDGSVYIYFGTWGIYDGFGCGVAKFNPDMKSFSDKKLIPNTEVKDFFEAPFVFKRNGIYYFMYSSGSCHDHTYRVQYATSKDSPMGPYEYKGCILETNADGTIHGPGHHSLLQDGDEYYIIYHRHNNPHATHGFHRQICIDRMTFNANGDIEKITPSHTGLLPTSVRKMPELDNLAYRAKVTASSYYDEWFRPEYATDDNNATLWKPATCTGNDYIVIDLGGKKAFNQIWTQFEYATYYYQYKIETSDDQQSWQLYADKTHNEMAGSPMIDMGERQARFIRITVTDREKNGHFGGIWNVKVLNLKEGEMAWMYGEAATTNAWKQRHATLSDNNIAPAASIPQQTQALVSIQAPDELIGTTTTTIVNMAGGDDKEQLFTGEHPIRIELKDGRPAFHFTGEQLFRSNFPLPPGMEYSAPYTISAWVLNPKVERNECIALLMPDRHDLSTIELCNGSDPQNGLVMHNASFENSGATQIKEQEGQWQHWTITYDGYMERHYLNGEMVSEKNMMLLLRPGDFMQIGASFEGNNPFNGYLHSLDIYDRVLSPEEVIREHSKPLAFDIDEAERQQRLAAQRELKDVTIGYAALTPTLLKIWLQDAQGKPLSQGFNDIAYDIKGIGTTTWDADPTILYTLPAPGRYVITAKAKSPDGEETIVSSKKVKVKAKDFITTVDEFTMNALDTRWKTLKGTKARNATANIANGILTLSSASGNFNAHSEDNAILLYQEVQGDFIMECKVVGMTGSDNQRTPAYNEGGLMVLCDTNPNDQQIVQMGIFPSYNCGNMLTTVSHHGRRPQFPRGNGWQYDPWLQIEREGDVFHIRTSHDGKEWVETAGSPVEMSSMPTNTPVKVGLFQVTYTDNEASVSFDDFKLFKNKNKK